MGRDAGYGPAWLGNMVDEWSGRWAGSMSPSLARPFSVSLVAILALAMLAVAVFGYCKAESLRSSLVSSRHGFVAATIARKVEDGLLLGLTLRQLPRLQETLDQEKARDPHIQAIQIYDPGGKVLFTTLREATGTHVPRPWLAPLSASAKPFSLMDGESRLAGVTLVNNLGQIEGAVVVRYAAAHPAGLMLSLGAETMVLSAAFAVLAVTGSLLVLWVVGRRLRAMETTLTQVMAEGAEPGKPAHPFEAALVQFAVKARGTADQLAEAAAEIDRLDRLA